MDGQIYVSFPAELGFPVDKPWVTVGPEGEDPISQAFGAMSDQMADSAALQRKFAEQAESIAVEELGSDTADGVAVTKHRITLSADDLVEFMEIPGMEGRSAEDAPFDEAEYTLWLDSGYLVRRDRGRPRRREVHGHAVVRLRRAGRRRGPPADQVTDLASLTEGLGTVDGRRAPPPPCRGLATVWRSLAAQVRMRAIWPRAAASRSLDTARDRRFRDPPGSRRRLRSMRAARAGES